MPRHSKEDIDRFFDFGLLVPKRFLYIGSLSSSIDDEESGTDYKMCEYAVKGIQYLDTIMEKPITIFMNNIGGNEFHGFAIFDTIKSCRSHVTIVCIGQCFSMGSIIFQSADTRLLSINCPMMIHDGYEELSGTPKAVSAWAKESDKNRKRMYRIYLDRIQEKHPKFTIKQIEKMCEHDKILSAHEAVELGLADDIFKNIHEIIGE